MFIRRELKLMPRSKEQNEIIKDKRREEILVHATHVFSKKGYSATKISDIASDAALSPGLIYHYFKSKEDMFVAITEQSVGIANKVVDKVMEKQIEPGEKMKIITSKILGGEGICKDANLWLLIIQISISTAIPKAASKLFKEKYTAFNFIKSIIEEGQKKGQFSANDDAESLTTAYYSLIQGICFFYAFNAADKNAGCKIPSVDMVLKILK